MYVFTVLVCILSNILAETSHLLNIILVLLILTQRPKHEKMYANNHPNCAKVVFLWGGGNFGISGNLWWYDTERSKIALTSYSGNLTVPTQAVVLCLLHLQTSSYAQSTIL